MHNVQKKTVAAGEEEEKNEVKKVQKRKIESTDPSLKERFPILFNPHLTSRFKMNQYYRRKKEGKTAKQLSKQEAALRDTITLKYFNEDLQPKVHHMLMEMRKRPDVLSYNDDYEVTINNTYYPGTNLIEIFDFFYGIRTAFKTAYDVEGLPAIPRESVAVFEALQQLYPGLSIEGVLRPDLFRDQIEEFETGYLEKIRERTEESRVAIPEGRPAKKRRTELLEADAAMIEFRKKLKEEKKMVLRQKFRDRKLKEIEIKRQKAEDAEALAEKARQVERDLRERAENAAAMALYAVEDDDDVQGETADGRTGKKLDVVRAKVEDATEATQVLEKKAKAARKTSDAAEAEVDDDDDDDDESYEDAIEDGTTTPVVLLERRRSERSASADATAKIVKKPISNKYLKQHLQAKGKQIVKQKEVVQKETEKLDKYLEQEKNLPLGRKIAKAKGKKATKGRVSPPPPLIKGSGFKWDKYP
jgi:hypothetical protein